MLFPTAETTERQHAHGHSPTESFAPLLRHVLAYKGWLISAAIIGFVLTGLALCFVTPTYDAEAVVIVDSRRNKLADAESALSSIVVDQYQSALKSELELVLSADVARHVILSLGLLRTPEYKSALTHVPMAERFKALGADLSQGVEAAMAWFGWQAAPRPAPDAVPPDLSDPPDAVMQNAVTIFQKKFSAHNDPKSLTIRMDYRSSSPITAAAVTNAVLQRYLAADEEVKAAAIARSEAWLKGRIADLRGQLETAEQAVEDFRAEHDLATYRDRSPLQQRLTELQGWQVDAQAKLSAAQALVAQTHNAGTTDAVAASADVLASRLIQGLRQQEAVLVTLQAQMAVTHLPTNVEMIKIADELARLRGQIRSELDRFAQSHQSDVRLAETRLQDLNDQVQAVQAKINAENAADIKLRSLEADAAAKRAVLNSFTQRYDQDAGPPFTPPDSRVVSWATVPVDASSPHYAMVLAAGTLGFAFLAFCMSLIHERLRSGFDGTQELEDELGLVVAGIIPQLHRRKARRPPLAAADPAPMRELALAVRALAHTAGEKRTTRVVLVTSAVAGEGKSSVALSLARSVANGGQRCLLIDADVRNPSLHTDLGVPATPGLVEVTVDGVPVDAVAGTPPKEQFGFLSAGRPIEDTLRPFMADTFGQLLTEMKGRFDVIVIDSAPVLLAPEGLVLAGCADLTLLIVKWHTTPREIARKAATMITRRGAGPCLAVLSQVNLRRMSRRTARRELDYYPAAYRQS